MIKDLTYEKEEQFLSKYAKKSKNTLGRKKDEEECEFRTCYQRDRDRILHSKGFRMLRNKTQVFLSPDCDNYRTRLTHTLDVSQIARSIARMLCLNEDLSEAIALGHDLGHTPFGHAGETVLNNLCEGGFEHSKQSKRVVELLENDGRGLNLTLEVIDGIANHQLGDKPMTLEGKVVCLADKIAYLNHDIDDAIKAKVLKKEDIPKEIIEVLGNRSSQRINTMITSIYNKSLNKNYVEMEEDVMKSTLKLRKFLFENVYKTEIALNQEKKAGLMLTELYEYFSEHIDNLPEFFKSLIPEYGKNRVVCDYIASMSDNFAIETFQNIFIPKTIKM